MAVRDIELRSCVSSNIYLSHDFSPFGSESIRNSAYQKLLCSVRIISRLDSRGKLVLHYFPAAILVYHGCTPTWRFHTGLCKFLRNISTNI